MNDIWSRRARDADRRSTQTQCDSTGLARGPREKLEVFVCQAATTNQIQQSRSRLFQTNNYKFLRYNRSGPAAGHLRSWPLVFAVGTPRTGKGILGMISAAGDRATVTSSSSGNDDLYAEQMHCERLRLEKSERSKADRSTRAASNPDRKRHTEENEIFIVKTNRMSENFSHSTLRSRRRLISSPTHTSATLRDGDSAVQTKNRPRAIFVNFDFHTRLRRNRPLGIVKRCFRKGMLSRGCR